MLDERLGRHSVLVAALALIPGAVVVAILAVGIIRPGLSYSHALVVAVFSIPPVAAFLLEWFNRRSLIRAAVLSGAALVMIAVWYAVLILPAAALCSLASDNACM